MNETRGRGFSIIGIGVVTCVACCAVPIVAFLGGLSIAGLASTLVIGIGGLLITSLALVALVIVRRRRAANTCQTTAPKPVAVAAPIRKVTL